MCHTRAGALLSLVAVVAVRSAAAQAPTDSARHDTAATPAPGAAATTVAAPAPDAAAVMPAMPVDVRGYRLTDSVPLGAISSGVDYSYTRNRTDVIHVFVSPYQKGTSLQTEQDTTAMVQSDVDRLRQSLDDAYRQGTLTAFRTLSERIDPLHTGGRSVPGYALIAGITHRGGMTAPAFTSPPCSARQMASRATSSLCAQATTIPGFQAYTYYAVFALPRCVIRVRAEMPRQSAINEQAPDFAHNLVAALAAPH